MELKKDIIIGKNDIDKSLDEITLDNDSYTREEIEKKILEHYKDEEDETLEFPTFKSGEFGELEEAYNYLDNAMLNKNYKMLGNKYVKVD